jgi:YD repeat-containing protein
MIWTGSAICDLDRVCDLCDLSKVIWTGSAICDLDRVCDLCDLSKVQSKIIATTYDNSGQVKTRTLNDEEEHYQWDSWGRLIGISNPAFT